jgi:hypothetical protein
MSMVNGVSSAKESILAQPEGRLSGLRVKAVIGMYALSKTWVIRDLEPARYAFYNARKLT